MKGFEGVFSHGAIGIGMDLALQAGLPLRDMEFFEPLARLVLSTRHMVLPAGLLSARWSHACMRPTAANLDLGDASTAALLRFAAAVQACIPSRPRRSPSRRCLSMVGKRRVPLGCTAHGHRFIVRADRCG